MASSSRDPIRKRTSGSNVDGASGPSAKKSNNNKVVDDSDDKKQQIIQSMMEKPASAIALSRMLCCDACNSFARAPVRSCGGWSGMSHKICSNCYTYGGGNCPVEGCTDTLVMKTYVNKELTDTIHAMDLPVPCKNRKNGCPKNVKEREMGEHEIECEFRFVFNKVIFKDLLFRMNEAAKKSKGKWQFSQQEDAWDGYKCNRVFRTCIEPDGRIFQIVLNGTHRFLIKVYAQVVGGERVANKYRVEFRLNSCEKEYTYSFHGPVMSADVLEPWNREDVFIISKKKFALFNKGFDYFADHSKDKNGEIEVPITAKLIKKELDIPKK